MKGIEIKCALIMKGVGIVELARRCDVSATTVSQTIYQNKNYCNRRSAEEIARILEKPVKELFPRYRDAKSRNRKRKVKTGNKRYPYCEVLNEQTKNTNIETSQPVA